MEDKKLKNIMYYEQCITKLCKDNINSLNDKVIICIKEYLIKIELLENNNKE